jgi:hypothetical protein
LSHLYTGTLQQSISLVSQSVSTAQTIMTAPPYPDTTLELFGQQGSAGVSTPFVFCFRTHGSEANLEEGSISKTVATLQTGLERLAQAFPWTAGRVVKVASSDRTTAGVYKIRHTNEPPRLIVKDQRIDYSGFNMKDFVEDGCPCRHLPEEMVSPYDVLPGKPDQVEARSAVLTVQVSQFQGGIMVNLVGHHQALDGTGQEQLAYLLNKACHGETFTDEEIHMGNMAREGIILPFPEEWQPRPDSRYLRRHVPVPAPPIARWEGLRPSVDPAEPCWTDFTFSAKALTKLKAEANLGLESGYVSTDDALTSLVWQTLARARCTRYPLDAPSTIGRAVNPRRYLGIPATYPGYITNMAFSTRSLGSLVESSLSSIAQEFRAAVDPATSNLQETTRELATLIHRARDKDSIALTGSLDPELDIMMSSWASMRCSQFDFGLGLGLPVAIRRTLIPPVLGLMYFLPKGREGEIVLHICARRGDLLKMYNDRVFAEYGTLNEDDLLLS